MRKAAVLAGFLLIGVFAGCRRAQAPVSQLVVGEVEPLTGRLAAEGQNVHKGVLLAVKEVNAAGGIGGRQVRLEVRDDQSKPELAQSAAEELASKVGALGLVGEYVDSQVAAVAQVAKAKQVPFVAAASLQKELVSPGHPYFWRVSNLAGFVRATTGFLLDQGVRSVSILHANTPGSKQLAEDQAARLKEAGVRVDGVSGYAPGTQDFSSLLARVRDARSEALLFNGAVGEDIQVTKGMRALGVEPRIVLFAFGADLKEFLSELGPLAEGKYGTVAWEKGLGGGAGQAFYEAYVREYGEEPGQLAAHGYAAARALLDGLRLLAEKPGGLEKALKDPRTVSGAFSALAVQTPLGMVQFTAYGDPVSYQRYVFQIRGGQRRIVFPRVFPSPTG